MQDTVLRIFGMTGYFVRLFHKGRTDQLLEDPNIMILFKATNCSTVNSPTIPCLWSVCLWYYIWQSFFFLSVFFLFLLSSTVCLCLFLSLSASLSLSSSSLCSAYTADNSFTYGCTHTQKQDSDDLLGLFFFKNVISTSRVTGIYWNSQLRSWLI